MDPIFASLHRLSEEDANDFIPFYNGRYALICYDSIVFLQIGVAFQKINHDKEAKK